MTLVSDTTRLLIHADADSGSFFHFHTLYHRDFRSKGVYNLGGDSRQGNMYSNEAFFCAANAKGKGVRDKDLSKTSPSSLSNNHDLKNFPSGRYIWEIMPCEFYPEGATRILC